MTNHDLDEVCNCSCCRKHFRILEDIEYEKMLQNESNREDVSNEASVINDSSTREKVLVLMKEIRGAENTGHEEINDHLEKVVTPSTPLTQSEWTTVWCRDYNMQWHLTARSARSTIGLYKCYEGCGKVFADEDTMERHVVDKHDCAITDKEDDEMQNESELKILEPKNTEMGFGLFD